MLKKLIALLITSAAFMLLPTVSAHAEEDTYVYTIINGEAEIIGFTGEPVSLEIPSVIEGCPVTEMRDNAFYNCGTLREIILPDSMKTMGHHCFYACSSLEMVRLPAELSELGMGCFCGCVSLSAVKLPETLKVLPDSCFRSCTSLYSVIIPQSVEVIEKFCFAGCVSLERVSLGGHLEEVGIRAFFMCNSLDEMYIPPSVKSLGAEAAGFIPPQGASPPSADGFTIYGERGSEAEAYARRNGIKFTESTGSVPAMSYKKSADEKPPVTVKLLVGGLILFTFSLAMISLRCHEV